jgi:hypothetical protein
LAMLVPRPSTEAATIKTFPLRQFYVTAGPSGLGFDGAHARSACTTGYHMASLWEILDVSNLGYNTSLGMTADDSGSGPPDFGGWVRTGQESELSAQPGVANCGSWTLADSVATGSYVFLNFNWSSGAPMTPVNPWVGNTATCNNLFAVWCVQD